MRAASYERLGPAREVLQVGDLPKPEPAEGEVRVRVRVSGVNPSDVKMRMGVGSAANQYPRIIPHSDGAGEVEAVGASVDRTRIGERVWLWNARWNRAFGTCAEYVCLPARQAVVLPDSVDFEVGACLGIPALTAWQAVTTDGGCAGQTVLVQGGAGAVGHYAIQMAKLMGATVIATVSSAAKADLAKGAGADVVVDYKTEDAPKRIKEITEGRGVARVIEVDLAANIKWLPQVVADYGLIVVYGSGAREVPVSFGESIIGNVAYRFFIVYNQPPAMRAQALQQVTALLDARRLQHVIGARFPLDRIADAHEAVESGKVMGNVIVTLD